MEDWEHRGGNRSANEEVEREGEPQEEEHKFPYPRGTRAGKCKTPDYTYNRWTPKYVVATDWTSHWKYKTWEKQQPEPSWEAGRTGAPCDEASWEEAERK